MMLSRDPEVLPLFLLLSCPSFHPVNLDELVWTATSFTPLQTVFAFAFPTSSQSPALLLSPCFLEVILG